MDIKKIREYMNGRCSVCKSCNGKACIGILPGMGGSGCNETFIRNIKDFIRYSTADPLELSKEQFLEKLALAPMTGVRENMGTFPIAHFTGSRKKGLKEFQAAPDMKDEYHFLFEYVKGAYLSGCMSCIGDGAHAFKLQSGLWALQSFTVPSAVFLKPFKQNILLSKIEKVLEYDPDYIGVDIDAVNLVNMTSRASDMEHKTVEHIKELAEISQKPFIVKGVLDALHAESFFNVGAAAVVVSNHGGRVGDLPSSISCLEKIVQKNKDKHIWFDSGIRNGKDIATAIAFGAEKVFIGRPAVIATFMYGAKGVEKLIEKYYDEYKDFVIQKKSC